MKKREIKSGSNAACRVRVCVMLTVMLAVSVSGFAQFGGGNGTSGSPYLITQAAHLSTLATNVNNGNAYSGVYFKLGNDISLSAYGSSYNSGKGWIPIGSGTNSFSGKFDGNNKVITNLYINDPTGVFMGLFGVVELGEISRLGVEELSIVAGAGMGGLVAVFLHGGTISNCYTTGSMQCGRFTGIDRSDAGGLVGFTGISSGGTMLYDVSIVDCYSTCDVKGSGFNVGGLVGVGGSIDMQRCYATGTISGVGWVGGLVGQSLNNNISYCAALNPKLIDLSGQGDASQYFDRITSITNNTTLANNIAFNGMYYYDNTISWSSQSWSNKGGANMSGQDITKEQINADSTLGGRFIGTNGWKTQNRKLPGLFGNTEEMPNYLFIPPPPEPPIITTTSLPNGKIDTLYNQPIMLTGDMPIVLNTISGSLPPGLNFYSGNPIRIAGTPTTAGTFTFTIVATNDAGSDTKTLSITIEDIIPVINITDVPTQAVIGTPLLLTGTVEPSDATNQNIVWKVLSAGNTGAIILNNNTLHVTAEGTVLVQAVIANGEGKGEDYMKEFYITATTEGGGGEGILQITNHELRVFPNPVKNQLKIKNYELKEGEVIEIYSVVGQTVGAYPCGRPETTIDISHLASGMYYLKVGNNTVRFVKE